MASNGLIFVACFMSNSQIAWKFLAQIRGARKSTDARNTNTVSLKVNHVCKPSFGRTTQEKLPRKPLADS
jgi:hypothetical protein